MKSLIPTLTLVLLLPYVCDAQVLFPNRGGTGTSSAPTSGQVLVGQGDGTYSPQATSTLGITAEGDGVGVATSSIDSEAELEGILSDVTDLFTDNDGALSDDDLSDNTTTDLAEGSNLYYTLSRVQNALLSGHDAIFGTSTSTNATSTNLAVTGAFSFLGTVVTDVSSWFAGLFDTNFAAKDTGDLSEGSNLYFTDARARQTISETVTGLDYSSASGVLSLTSGYAIPLSASTTDWQTAFSWGDHAAEGYLTTVDVSDDTNLSVAATGLTLTGDALALSAGFLIPLSASTTEWAAAYSWGDHASAGYITDYTVTEADVTQHEAAISITESQISDLDHYTDADIDGSETAFAGWDKNASDDYDSSDFSTDFSAKDTGDLTEGSNLYFTNARARTAISETAAGLDYATSTGVLSLTSGYSIPLSASTTEWATAYGWGDHSSAGYLTSVGPTDLASSDFGDFTCNGTTCSLDGSYLTGVAWGDITGTLSNQSDLQSALDAKLSTTSAASTYQTILGNEAGLYSALSDVTQFWEAGDTISSGTLALGSLSFTGTLSDANIANALTISSSGAVTWSALTSYPTGCNNQFVTTIGDTLTCASVTSAAITNGTIVAADINLSDLTLTDLTFDVGSVTKTEFGYLDGVTSALQTQIDGKLATAGGTISGALTVTGTSTLGTTTVATHPLHADFDKSFAIASTSPDFSGTDLTSGTTTWEVWHPTRPTTVESIYCDTDTGTALVRVGDGANWTEAVTCSTSPTADTSLSNNTFVARESFIIQIGSGASDPNRVTPTFNFTHSE